MSKILATCLLLAAKSYSVPPAVLVGILEVEGGKVGQEVGPNSNGSYDLGPMQINTIWLPKLSEYWGVSEDTARKWVRDNACTNMSVAAWILKKNIEETESLPKAIAYYHSRTPKFGKRYKKKVINAIRNKGLITPSR